MQASDRPQRHPEASHETVEAEAIIVNLNTGSYYTANDTATMFWELLDGQRTIADCARLIAREYDVEAEVVEADLLELAATLEDEGLIIV